MSEYFRVLNRLFDEHRAPEMPPARRAPIALAPVPHRPAPVRELRSKASAPKPLRLLKPTPVPVASRPAPAPDDYGEILDALQRLRSTGTTRCVVLASLSEGDDTLALAQRIVEAGRERGMRIEAIRIAVSDAIAKRSGTTEVEGDELYLDVCRAEWKTRLATWQATMSSDSIALLVAPPISTSVDAAMIASACEGLAVIVELGKTPTHALSQAVHRIRNTGCNLLGSIVIGSDGLPAWGRRLLRSIGEYPASER